MKKSDGPAFNLKTFQDPTQSSRLFFQLSLLVLFIIVVLSTLGYHFVFKREFIDSFYFMLITMTTIGYAEMPDMSDTEHLYTIFVILAAYSAFAVTITLFLKLIVEGEINGMLERRRMDKRLAKLNNHIIICGFGRLSRVLVRELIDADVPFCIVDVEEKHVEEALEHNYIVLMGDATHDEILVRAGIESARCIICATGSDPDNLYITLTAKQLNPEIYIIARAMEDSDSKKMYQVGANKVVQPYQAGARSITQAALKPNIDSFIDTLFSQEQIGIAIEEFCLTSDSTFVGKTLRDMNLNKEYDVIVIGIKRFDGKMIFNPKADTALGDKDVMITMGSRFNLARLQSSLVI